MKSRLETKFRNGVQNYAERKAALRDLVNKLLLVNGEPVSTDQEFEYAVALRGLGKMTALTQEILDLRTCR